MKYCLFSIVFCIFFSVNLHAQTNLLRELLDLPAPPPVAAETKNENGEKRQRSEEFYADENVPLDDAPIEDVFDYWKRKAADSFYGRNKSPKISANNAARLLDKFALEPLELANFLKIFPDDFKTAGTIKDIFDISQNAEGVDDNWRKLVKEWLKFNSKFYIDEMIAEVSKVKDKLNNGSVAKQDELIALTKLDWEIAEPILKTIENDAANVRASTLAKTLLYKNAVAAKNAAEIEKYRNDLKEIVSNRNLPASARDNASDALFETEWQGQDEYYFSLMEDETLLFPQEKYQLFTPLTTLASKNPDKWIPILAKLVGSKNRAVHNAAVQSLMRFKNRKDALEPLLPWLSAPNWADINWSPGGRITYMQVVADVDLPESLPGLIWIIENEDENVHWAARSLAKYKDARAVPALLNALNRIGEETYREEIIKAIIACGGLTVDEQLSALEYYAEFISKPENIKKIQNRSPYEDENPLPKAVSVGKNLAEQIAPDEKLIRLLIQRQKILQKEKPETAKILSGIMSRWEGRLIDLEMLDRIGDGKADIETIVGALARREELRTGFLNEIYALRVKNGLAGGIAACLLEDETDIVSAFHSKATETQIGTLACARLLRKSLPVAEVGALLNSQNSLLALAAERYLEAEDSTEARRLILSKHPGEALILGARDSFNPAKQTEFPPMLGNIFASVNSSYSNSLHPDRANFDKIDKFEDKLRDEIKANPDLLEIYTIVPTYIVRVYKDKIVFTFLENDARYYEGILKKEEFNDLKQFLAASNLEETPPIFGNCHYDCGIFEYARFNRNGGRRFFAYTNFMSFIGILAKFQDLRESEQMKLRYYLQNKIPDLKVLLNDTRFKPKAVWKNGDDFRVLISDEERKNQIDEEIQNQNEIDEKNEEMDYQERGVRARKRRAERAFEHFEWREFKNGNLGERVDEPLEVPFLRDNLSFPSTENLSDNESIWQSKKGNYVVRVGSNFETYGLWKTNRYETIKIGEGWFGGSPIVSGDWAVIAKTDDNWAVPNYIVRVNLRTGKELKINLPPADNFEPLAFVPAHNKILLRRAGDENSEKKENNPSPQTAEYYLLDVNTGKTELVKGEFQPLIRQIFRQLQSTGKPNEFWAAIYNRTKNETDIGIYNAKNFSFKSLLKLPEILLDSMDIWVDVKEAKVYFIYAGDYGDEAHLLSLPIPKNQ